MFSHKKRNIIAFLLNINSKQKNPNFYLKKQEFVCNKLNISFQKSYKKSHSKKAKSFKIISL